MGWSDKAVARARLAAAKAVETSKELLTEADEALLSARPGYADLKRNVAETAGEAREAASRKLAEAGTTKSGAKIGGATRTGLEKLGQMPILSAPMDAAKARHGIEQLAQACRDEPDEPMHAVRLAEALDRVHQDLVKYRTARAAVDPMYLIHRQVIVTAAQLGKDAEDPTRAWPCSRGPSSNPVGA